MTCARHSRADCGAAAEAAKSKRGKSANGMCCVCGGGVRYSEVLSDDAANTANLGVGVYHGTASASGNLSSTPACAKCAVGRRAVAAAGGGVRCEDCPLDSWGNASASTSCYACAAGKVTNSSGSTNWTACVDCPAGKYKHATIGGRCEPCRLGTWQNKEAQLYCHECATTSSKRLDAWNGSHWRNTTVTYIHGSLTLGTGSSGAAKVSMTVLKDPCCTFLKSSAPYSGCLVVHLAVFPS